LPAVYHRLFVICGIFIVTGSILLFLHSRRFQSAVTNTYTYKDVVPLIFSWLRHGKVGEKKVAELLMQKLGGVIKGKMQDLGNRIKEKAAPLKEQKFGKRKVGPDASDGEVEE
jgi:hypothetical protein